LSESGEGGKGNRCIWDFDLNGVVVRDICEVANPAGHLRFHLEWVEPKRSGEGKREDAMVGPGIQTSHTVDLTSV
jgi:hypothetical protein